MKPLLGNGTLLTLGLVGVVAAVGAANKAGLYGSRNSVALPTLEVMLDLGRSMQYWKGVVQQVAGDWLLQDIQSYKINAALEQASTARGPFFRAADAFLSVVEGELSTAQMSGDAERAEAYETALNDIDDVRLETYKRKSPASSRLMDQYQDSLDALQKDKKSALDAQRLANKAADSAAKEEARLAPLLAAQAEEKKLRAEVEMLERIYEKTSEQDTQLPGGHEGFIKRLRIAENALSAAESRTFDARLRAAGRIF